MLRASCIQSPFQKWNFEASVQKLHRYQITQKSNFQTDIKYQLSDIKCQTDTEITQIWN